MSKPTGNPKGRPPKFSSPEEMQPLIDAYFAKCDKGIEKEFYDKRRKTVITIKESIPYTMEKLALALGFCSVSNMDEYIKRPAFTQTLTHAKTHIIGTFNENVMLGVYAPQFAPFYLCNIDRENYKPINNTNVNIGIQVNQADQLNKGIARVASIPKQIAERKGIKLLTTQDKREITRKARVTKAKVAAKT